MRKLLFTLLFSIVFWNLENCFDCVDGGYSSSDAEFSARGSRRWTRKRFDAKMAMIGKTLLWCDSLPAVVGVAEVENAKVMKSLVYGDVLAKCGYRYVHYDSRDPRGIDVGLLYRQDLMNLVASYPIPVVRFREDGTCDTLKTRDILYVCLEDRSDASVWHFFVNHHPSKYGGATSSSRRVSAMKTLRGSVDSLLRAGQTNIVAMGDFNDIPDGEAFSEIDGALINLGAILLGVGTKSSGPETEHLGGGVKLSDPSSKLSGPNIYCGTIRYHGNWQLIDNFLVSPKVAESMKMEILKPPFLMERDRQFPGEKPRRTYIGPRYNGGVSDHLPIYLHK